MNKVYVIEEMLAPGIWVLMSDVFYSQYEVNKEFDDANATFHKLKRNVKLRITELKPSRFLEEVYKEQKTRNEDNGDWL